jgi:hypothetical protein
VHRRLPVPRFLALLPLVAALVAPAALASPAHARRAHSTPRTVRIATPASTSARAPASFFGVVAAETFWKPPGGLPGMLEEFDRLGVGTLRQKVEWARIEPTPGRFDFSGYDPGVGELARRGVRILPILFNPPKWASSAPAGAGGVYPPRSNAEFASFARAVVARYGPSGSFWAQHPEIPPLPIRAWQVWNEPNLPGFWRSGPDPAAYAAMLEQTSAAIRGVDPDAEVVTAGLSSGRSAVPIPAFVRGLYRAGAGGSFDVLAIHPYAHTVLGSYRILAQARRTLDSQGDDQIPLWATEVGWATAGPPAAYSASERGQARLITRLLATLVAQSRRLKLIGVVYYQWKDTPADPAGRESWGSYTGLRTREGRAKPAFVAFARAVRRLTTR